jgi:hypothetical protein
MRTTFFWGATNSVSPTLQSQEVGTPTAPYLTDRRNAALLTEPPRRVSRLDVFGLVAGPLLIPALIAGIGVWIAIDMATNGSFQIGQIVVTELGLCGAAALFFQWGWSAARREYQLLRDGRVILGEVVVYSAITSMGYTQPVAGGGEDPWVQVTVTTEYAFTTPSGTKLTGRVRCVYTQTYSEPEVRPGDVVAMLYLDDKTYRVL